MKKPTFIEQISSVTKFLGLGRRQKRSIKKAMENIPSEPLKKQTDGGRWIEYFPQSAKGQFLICNVKVPMDGHPNDTVRYGLLVSMYEFTDPAMRKRFEAYHEGLSGESILRWADGKKVSLEDLRREVN